MGYSSIKYGKRQGDGVMKIIQTAAVVVPALAMLMVASLEVAANAHGIGFGAHPFHSAGHFRSAQRYGADGQWPLYGGIATVPPDVSDDIMVDATPETVVFVPEPPRRLSCHHSQQIITVLSEEGGTRQITITRC